MSGAAIKAPYRRARAIRLLVIAGNAKARIELDRILRAGQFDVMLGTAVADVRRRLRSSIFDAIVVAGPLGGPLVAQVCGAIRQATSPPILCLIRKRAARERVAALRAGADDVMSSPFATEEVVERVRALVRRSALERRRSVILSHEDLVIDLERQEVQVGGATVHLTPVEFRLLVFLARAPGRPFTRREILEYLWRSPHVNNDRVCDVYVSNLRRKIERDPGFPEHVVTVRGIGYALAGE